MDLIRPAFSISHDCAIWTIHATSEIKGKFWLKAIRVILAVKYGINTKINPCGKVISLCLEGYRKGSHAPFISNTFISDTSMKFYPK